jgi:hypothetical protein
MQPRIGHVVHAKRQEDEIGPKLSAFLQIILELVVGSVSADRRVDYFGRA